MRRRHAPVRGRSSGAKPSPAVGPPGIESGYAVQSRTWVARAAEELGSGRLDGSLTRRGLLPHRDGNSGSRPPLATQKELPSGWVFHHHQHARSELARVPSRARHDWRVVWATVAPGHSSPGTNSLARRHTTSLDLRIRGSRSQTGSHSGSQTAQATSYVRGRDLSTDCGSERQGQPVGPVRTLGRDLRIRRTNGVNAVLTRENAGQRRV